MGAQAKSIYGRDAAINTAGQFMAPKGFQSGSEGSNFQLINPSVVTMTDDFLGDVVADQWNYTEGTDTTTADGAIVEGVNGVFRLTAGDSAGTVAADGAQLNSALNWKANQGNLVFEARIALGAITTVNAFIGLTDTKSLEAPATLSGTTYTTNATDAVGVLFCTTATTDTWRLVGVANDVDATHVDTGLAPVAGTYETWRIEVSTAGKATFYRNGAVVGSLSGAVTPTVALTPVFIIFPEGAVAGRTMDIDYVHVSANRV
jgi:hypothetical protein